MIGGQSQKNLMQCQKSFGYKRFLRLNFSKDDAIEIESSIKYRLNNKIESQLTVCCSKHTKDSYEFLMQFLSMPRPLKTLIDAHKSSILIRISRMKLIER